MAVTLFRAGRHSRNCLEMLATHGKAGTINKSADELTAAEGVKHGLVVITSGPERSYFGTPS